MKTLADRFRHLYEYECDCNANTLAMLASVPADRRAAPEFQKAVDRMAHLVAARQRWLNRLGQWPAPTDSAWPAPAADDGGDRRGRSPRRELRPL